MNWITLSTLSEVDQIKERSFQKPQVIFKHSTRCSISSMAKSRLEKSSDDSCAADFYYLDLIAYRHISNHLADVFDVVHQSPQVLLIKNGECMYEESHSGIRMEEILEQAAL